MRKPREFYIDTVNEMQKWYGGMYKYSAFDGKPEEHLILVREVMPCECDVSVGFFCEHCSLENQYIQDLQNTIMELKDRLYMYEGPK